MIRRSGIASRARLAPAAAAAVALGAAFVSCGRIAPRAAIDPALAVCIPADTLAVAGVNLGELRASALYGKLPASAAQLLAPLREASYLLVAYNGKDVLAVARGSFSEAPQGAALLAKDLAVSGSPDAVRTAEAQRGTGRTGAPWLLDRAAEAAKAGQIWVAARGGIAFPLTGDAANLNRFLSFADYATLTVRLDAGVRMEALGAGRTPESAQRLEDGLRAFLTLAATGAGRDRSLADLLRSGQVIRNGLLVRVEMSATAEQAAKLLGAVAP
jgi:hypothetical protein